jgi:transposase-like protein
METNQKRKFSAEFKSKVVIEALKERQTIEELARKYELHPTQISLWKKEFLERAANVFSNSVQQKENKQEQEKMLEKLYAQIGQQKVEIDWLKKKLQ